MLSGRRRTMSSSPVTSSLMPADPSPYVAADDAFAHTAIESPRERAADETGPAGDEHPQILVRAHAARATHAAYATHAAHAARTTHAAHQPSTMANTRGATIDASLSMMY